MKDFDELLRRLQEMGYEIKQGKYISFRAAGHGCVVIQGHGTLGVHPCEAPTMLRFGGRSADEFFIGEQAARAGVCVKNLSLCEPLVLLKHFGPNAGAPEGPFPE